MARKHRLKPKKKTKITYFTNPYFYTTNKVNPAVNGDQVNTKVHKIQKSQNENNTRSKIQVTYQSARKKHKH
jgi:hypothetical protein